MGFSPLADMRRRIPDGGRSSPRESAVTGFGLHHNAGVDSYGEASNPGREVSAHYWIANDGTIIPHVDETRRAWTSGAAGYPAGALADHRNITVEISNSPEGVRTGTWAISDAAMASLIALIADVYKRYGLGPVRRGAGGGIGVHSDWVPTACPGPYVMANLQHIIAAAEAARIGAAPAPVIDTAAMRRARNRKDHPMHYVFLNPARSDGSAAYAIYSPGVLGSWEEFDSSQVKGKFANAMADQYGQPTELTTARWVELQTKYSA